MKNIITIMAFLVITLSTMSLGMATSDEKSMPAPEIIACESQGTCEMTSLVLLLKLAAEDEQMQDMSTMQKKVVVH